MATSPNPVPAVPEAPKPGLDYRKLLAVGIAGVMLPTVGTWAQNCMGATCPAFTVGNVITPAVPTIVSAITALVALFLNPRKAN